MVVVNSVGHRFRDVPFFTDLKSDFRMIESENMLLRGKKRRVLTFQKRGKFILSLLNVRIQHYFSGVMYQSGEIGFIRFFRSDFRYAS